MKGRPTTISRALEGDFLIPFPSYYSRTINTHKAAWRSSARGV